MRKLNQFGTINTLLIPLIVAVLCFGVAAVMSVMYYSKFTDQRDNNQPKIEAAVETAKEEQKKALDAEYLEKEKMPNKTFITPSEFGSVKLSFPKTWSSYVNNKTSIFDFYSHPNYVPATGVNYALRMTVESKQFATEIKKYDNQVKKGDLKASSIVIAGTTGVRMDGFLEKTKEGSMVIFPLRDKTLRVWTESKEYSSDFNNIVLKSLSFVP